MENDGTGPASVELNGGQGVLVGPGGVQNNYWMKPLVDLAALSPHAAVDRIRDIAHNDAVDLFASMPKKDLTEVLRVLLRADEARAIAILADVNPRKVAELVSPHEGDFPWLVYLPAAVRAINERAMTLGWGHDGGAGRLERAAQHPRVTIGFFRQFSQGRIYCNNGSSTAYAVRGPVAEVAGLANGTIPVSHEQDAAVAATGRCQRFIDSTGRDVAVYSSSETGIFRVTGQTLAFYERLGGPGPDLGFPTSNSKRVQGEGWYQEFQHGWIYHRQGRGLTAVPAETVNLAASPLEPLGWPVSEEKPVAGRTGERIQFFENGVVTVRDGRREIWLRYQ